jgi:isoaspartyl peptidase/L-asparaginase-like protein (Ntn-hydrolase superfamily)
MEGIVAASEKAVGNGTSTGGRLTRAAGEVTDHPVVDAGARVGYAVNGVLHLLIAWLGPQVAFGAVTAQ